MAKKFLILALAGFFMAGAAGVSAQTSTGSEVRPNAVQQRLQEQRDKISESVRQQLEERRAEMQRNIDAKRAQFQSAVEDKKALVQEKREELMRTFREKVQNVRDEQKRNILIRLEEQLPQVQERILKNMTASLDRIEGVLEKISSRAEELAQGGADVSAVRTAIVAAEEAISRARTAIQNEAGTTYTIDVSDEEEVKENFGIVRAQLAKNLQAVRNAVKAAQESVRATLVELKKAGAEKPEITPSPEM
jgi:outer membrane murein-binding lipoprotein Lpp/gas vesicle protein